jgi:hypothetical protein
VTEPDETPPPDPAPVNGWLLTITAEAEVIPGEPEEERQ